ncbi:MAG: tRNA uracil 4-sulfurtransferase ThiI [Bacillota bacterium]|nr:tRNA uracil 4-sulfurtransferase ThiI [Bacillota bacterium]
MTGKILVRYGEIALKGKNRKEFELQLQRNLKAVIKDNGGEVARLHGRMIISAPMESRDQILGFLNKVFGIVSASSITETSLDYDEIRNTVIQIALAEAGGYETFKIESRRSNKNFSMTSPELNRNLGAAVLENLPNLRVKLEDPDLTISVEIGFKNAFLYQKRMPGPGGLPVGISGRSLLLLSGGIDSPVAGWLSMKRGLALEALHFHSFPFTSRRAEEKVADICRKLAVYGNKIPLHMISVTNIQQELKKAGADSLQIILLRRMMLRLAEYLSQIRDLKALVTGDNLGQVASQTLESLSVIGEATEMLILRPLVGMDKEEIIQLSIAIDTYQTSILPYDDCCTLFVPKNPVTKPRIETVEEIESRLDLEGLIQDALGTLKTEIIRR